MKERIKNWFNWFREKIKNGLGFFAPQPVVYKDSTNAIISKNMHWTLHPTECRFLTTREILAMMGMPSDFVSNNRNLVFTACFGIVLRLSHCIA